MVQVGQRAILGLAIKLVVRKLSSPEETGGSATLVSDDQALLPSAFYLKYFHDRSVSRFHVPHNVLVDLQRIIAGLFEEQRVRDSLNVCFAVKGVS